MSTASYRLYLRGPSGEIVGRDDFEAEHDAVAIAMAELLWEACADLCDHFELWKRERLVGRSVGKALRPVESADEIGARMQESLIQREEAIRNSEWAVARSKRLLERLRHLNAGFTKPVALARE
jgi:hypothetical protein